MAALARPLGHAALDVGGTADLEEHRLWLGIPAVLVKGRNNVAGASAAAAAVVRRRLEETSCGVDRGWFGGFGRQPEHVDVAGLVGVRGRFGDFSHEGRGCVGIESVWDERLEVACRGSRRGGRARVALRTG